MLKKFHILECSRYSNAGNYMRFYIGDFFISEVHRSAINVIEPADRIENGRLSGTVRSHDAKDLAF